MYKIFLILFTVLTTVSINAQWVQINGSMQGEITCFAVADTKLYMGTQSGLFFSTNDGTNWTEIHNGSMSMNVNALAVSDTNIYVGAWGNKFYLSTNNGTNWTEINTDLTNYSVANFYALAISGTNLFAGTDQGLFLSTNNGTNWTRFNIDSIAYPATALAFSGTKLFVGSRSGVFLSTNNGTSWAKVKNGDIIALAVSGTNAFATTWGNGFYLSTNNGTDWAAANNSNLQDTVINALAVSGTHLFAGTFSNIVWMRPLSEIITSVSESKNNMPAIFSLKQNYPNPFNPSTTIDYSVPKSGMVTIKVYDILGKEIMTLINEEKASGNYSVQFSGGNLASGVYFYKMQADGFVQTKKLLLLK